MNQLAALRRATNDSHAKVRADAHSAVWRMTGNTQTVPALVDALQHKDWMVSETAVRHLANIGRQSVPPLTSVLANDRADFVRATAREALDKITPP